MYIGTLGEQWRGRIMLNSLHVSNTEVNKDSIHPFLSRYINCTPPMGVGVIVPDYIYVRLPLHGRYQTSISSVKMNKYYSVIRRIKNDTLFYKDSTMIQMRPYCGLWIAPELYEEHYLDSNMASFDTLFIRDHLTWDYKYFHYYRNISPTDTITRETLLGKLFEWRVPWSDKLYKSSLLFESDSTCIYSQYLSSKYEQYWSRAISASYLYSTLKHIRCKYEIYDCNKIVLHNENSALPESNYILHVDSSTSLVINNITTDTFSYNHGLIWYQKIFFEDSLMNRCHCTLEAFCPVNMAQTKNDRQFRKNLYKRIEQSIETDIRLNFIVREQNESLLRNE